MRLQHNVFPSSLLWIERSGFGDAEKTSTDKSLKQSSKKDIRKFSSIADQSFEVQKSGSQPNPQKRQFFTAFQENTAKS